MQPRVVCVDDEPRVLKGLRRRIGRDYDVATAESGDEALTLMRSADPFQVIISDMRMPGMTGAQFLAKARTEFPDTVRILLTGQSDLDDAIAAVNDGHIFRFLSKPCPPEILMPALEDGVEHYRLIQAERELLDGTVRGAVTLLTEILGIKDPEAASRGSRLKRHVRNLASELEIAGSWDFEVAAMLAQIGYTVMPGDVVDRWRAGDSLTEGEKKMLTSHAQVAQDLLTHIPRLDTVAAMIGALGSPQTPGREPRVELGVRLLSAVMEYDAHLQNGLAEGAAVAEMKYAQAPHTEEVLRALDRMAVTAGGYLLKSVSVNDLVSGVILAADLYAADGRLLLTEGTELSLAARTRINQYADHVGIKEPVEVRVPI